MSIELELDLFPSINTEHIILGIRNEGNNLENSIILIIKRYIYINKWTGNRICFHDAIRYLKQYMIIELNFHDTKQRTDNVTKWAVLKYKISEF